MWPIPFHKETKAHELELDSATCDSEPLSVSCFDFGRSLASSTMKLSRLEVMGNTVKDARCGFHKQVITASDQLRSSPPDRLLRGHALGRLRRKLVLAGSQPRLRFRAFPHLLQQLLSTTQWYSADHARTCKRPS